MMFRLSSPILLSLLVAFSLLLQLPQACANHAPTSLCKYSVRDVAFVDVHGQPWQLQLIKPAGLEERAFEAMNADLRKCLDRTNLGYIWLDASSSEAKAILKSNGSNIDKITNVPNELPMCFLKYAGLPTIPLALDPALSLQKNMGRLVDSDCRTRILNDVVESLCVFVLIESGDQSKDENATRVIVNAMQRVERQMWTFEKATKSGPAFVKVNVDDESEFAFLQTIGVSTKTETPAVAVVFGQGRRLGDLIVGNDITEEKLIGRASVCGRDCECNLDKNWLYTTQFVHRWSLENERQTEESLNFDPRSALVIAEVAQILQKSTNQPSDDDSIDLGSGLLIHDLDPAGPTEAFGDPAQVALEDNASIRDDGNEPVVPRSSSWIYPGSITIALILFSILVVAIRLREQRS